MNEDQRLMYFSIASIRDSEATRRWTRTQFFFLMNSAAVSFVATQLQVEQPLYFIACALGIWVSVLWLLATVNGNQWIYYWDRCLANLEAQEQPVSVFRGVEFERLLSGITFHYVVLLLVNTFIVLWSALFFYSFLSFLAPSQ